MPGDDHPALTSGHLFIGVEGEDCSIANRTGAPPVVLGPNGFTGILDHRQIVGLGKLENGIHLGGLTKGVDGQNCAELPATAPTA